MNFKLTVKAKILILCFMFLVLFDACSCKTCNNEGRRHEVPFKIFDNTDKYIVSKVGKNFFENYIHLDFNQSTKKKNNFLIRYNFRMDRYNFVDEEIVLLTDSTGNVINSSGIPVCVNEETGCEFKIDKNEAVQIAINNNLAKGIKEWAVEFRWSEVVNRYVWHIISTNNEYGKEDNYKASGEEIMIHPVTGEVLEKRTWKIL